ncbi:MAG: hypothetical protein QXU81_00075 [Candidatus Bathyarchaeia archaeon]
MMSTLASERKAMMRRNAESRAGGCWGFEALIPRRPSWFKSIGQEVEMLNACD